MADNLNENDIRDRIRYAEQLHSDAQTEYENIKPLLTREYDIPEDVEDLGVEIFQPSKAMAIIGKAASVLRSRAKETTEIVPLNGTGGEESTCTKLEKYAEAVMRRGAEGRRIDPYLAATLWFAIYGKYALELRFMPQYLQEDSRRFPIRPFAPAADTICEVTGDDGVIYYAKVYQRMKLDILTELQAMHSPGKGWSIPDLDGVDPTDFVEIREYWDETHKALFVENDLVWLNEHNYGFCPLVVAYCDGLPFEEPKWWVQGMIRPIADALKHQAALQSKMLTAVDLHFWPIFSSQDPSGLIRVFQATPGLVVDADPQATVTQLNASVNEGLLEHLWSRLDGDINQMSGLPELSFGKEPSAGASGYMVAQILGQIMDRFEQKLDDLGRAKAEHVQHILRMSHVLLADKEWKKAVQRDSWDVAAEPKPGSRKKSLKITEEDLKPVREVHVSIKPMLEQEKAMAAEQSERLRRPGTDGRPMMSDKTLRRDYLRIENPDEEEELIEDQMMRQDPQVQEILRQEYIEKFQEGREKDKKRAKAPPGPQEYECPVCGFQAMSEESKVGQLCPSCEQGRLQLANGEGAGLAPAGIGGAPGMAQQSAPASAVPGLPSQFGGGAGQPPENPLMQMQRQITQQPPVPRR